MENDLKQFMEQQRETNSEDEDTKDSSFELTNNKIIYRQEVIG
jgi:hypothetical protein